MGSLAAFRPQGVVFDLDGTLTDNMSCHSKAFSIFLTRHGLPPMTMAMRARLDGKRNSEIFPILFERDLTLEELRAFSEEKEGIYRELSRERLQPLRGVEVFLDRLADHGIAVAVATSSPEKNIAHTLGAIGLADRIGVIARSDMVPRGKPFPDVFLRAAEELGVAPEYCLAFEDAPVGVAAARSAGMRCIAITSTFSAETLAASEMPPDAAYPDYEAFLAGDGAWLQVDRSVRL
jgi:beta-phosphoglucomutase family hydrolase